MSNHPDPTDPRLAVNLAGVALRNPLLTASGTCGYGPEYADAIDYATLGGFTTKSVTRHERPGNFPDRIAETPGGLLNAIGLANVGIERFLTEKLPFIQTMRCPVFINVAGYTIEDYVVVCRALADVDGIAGIELNVSCPNVAKGLMFGTDPGLLRQVTRAARDALGDKLLIVKLSPNVTDIVALAGAAIEGGAQALSLINTYVGLVIRAKHRRAALGNVTGGLSGPAIKPLALLAVHRVYREIARDAGVPIIGMGGVQSTEDAVEFLLAGATAVAVGTALFVDPTTPIRIARELPAWLDHFGVKCVNDLIGTLRTESAKNQSGAAPVVVD
ncbi:MAG: dihydroorotate dehydrogenase [Phycisphaerales bacterium]|nr:dihydroorotate dehydrogenase [Phycisphaerales bacterium]